MRYPSGHKERTREHIVACARRLFAERGYAGTSIAHVMAACGLTPGGFYRHFRSKGALYAEACREVAGPCAGPTPHTPFAPDASDAPDAPDALGPDTLQRHLPRWLRQRALAPLAADTTSEQPQVRQAAMARLAELVSEIRRCVEGEPGAAHDPATAASPALATTALVVGTVAMVQASSDEAARQRWLAACAIGAHPLLGATRRRSGEVYFWALNGD